jgi:hypothetical protein
MKRARSASGSISKRRSQGSWIFLNAMTRPTFSHGQIDLMIPKQLH